MIKTIRIETCGRQNDSLTDMQQTHLIPLIVWLQETPKTMATLQNIKRAFPTWTTVNGDIECFIALNILQRRNRCYELTLKLVSLDLFQKLLQEAQAKAQQFQQALPDNLQQDWLCAAAVEHFRQQFQKKDLVALLTNDYCFYDTFVYESNSFLFSEINSPAPVTEELGLAYYFTSGASTEINRKMRKLVGDVNPAYFLDMSGKTLALIASQAEQAVTKTTIFTEALALFSYLKQHEQALSSEKVLKISSASELSQLKTEYLELLSKTLATIEKPRALEKELTAALVLNELLKPYSPLKAVVKIK